MKLNTAKKKKLLIALVLLVVGSAVVILCWYNGSHDDIKASQLTQICQDYANTYEVITNSNTEEANIMVKVVAPDFVLAISEQKQKNTPERNDVKDIIKFIKNHPEAQKEYIFPVEELSDSVVGEAFVQEVIHELTVFAITETDSVNPEMEEDN